MESLVIDQFMDQGLVIKVLETNTCTMGSSSLLPVVIDDTDTVSVTYINFVACILLSAAQVMIPFLLVM